MFSKLKYTKTNFHASLKADQMESLLCILQQGPELENYGGMISGLTKNYYIYQFQHAKISSIHYFILEIQEIIESHDLKGHPIFHYAHPITIKVTFSSLKYV